MKHLALALLITMVAPVAHGADIALVTGPRTGTYYAFGKDIETLAAEKKMQVVIESSDGSVENIKRINGDRELTLGIVQSDVLGFLSRSQNSSSKNYVSNLGIVFPFYQEEVHVLAREEITDFKELQGKRVAVGEEASGHMLTAVNLFAIEQIVPSQINKITPEEGVVAVLKGDLDAVILVGGKPMKIFQNMEDLTDPENQRYSLLLQHVHFLPLNNAKFYDEYEPTEITPQDYRFVKNIVPTIAVESALVSYQPGSKATKTTKERCETLRRFAGIIEDGLPELKRQGHPKWQEVELKGSLRGWKKDQCVWPKG